MELHERLTDDAAGRPGERARPVRRAQEPLHLAVIGELGPQLFNVDMDPNALRDRVMADIRGHLSPRAGHRPRRPRPARGRDRRRHPRPRPARAAARRRQRDGDHGQRPVRRLGRAPGPALRDDGPLQRRLAPAPDHQQDRGAGRPPHRRVVADGRRPPAGRQPRERGHPAALADGPARHDPEVLAAAARPDGPGPARDAQRRRRSSSSSAASAPS